MRRAAAGRGYLPTEQEPVADDLVAAQAPQERQPQQRGIQLPFVDPAPDLSDGQQSDAYFIQDHRCREGYAVGRSHPPGEFQIIDVQADLSRVVGRERDVRGAGVDQKPYGRAVDLHVRGKNGRQVPFRSRFPRPPNEGGKNAPSHSRRRRPSD